MERITINNNVFTVRRYSIGVTCAVQSEDKRHSGVFMVKPSGAVMMRISSDGITRYSVDTRLEYNMEEDDAFMSLLFKFSDIYNKTVKGL